MEKAMKTLVGTPDPPEPSEIPVVAFNVTASGGLWWYTTLNQAYTWTGTI